ncbi:MAG TPA: dTMP kinase [Candidatus Polarisedimenticolaceae bacterium]|nr:dTMP kinase [Candidatus Polarisedimenticolaceae bacterium]
MPPHDGIFDFDADDERTGSAGAGAEPAFTPATQADPRAIASAGRRGFFVTFEGIEGSGKSTQIERLAERLRAAGEPVVVTREPGGSPLGRRLRTLLLAEGTGTIDALAELLLYVADRAQHLREVVEPALAQGTHVLCDRFADATLAYQGFARGIDLDLIRLLHRTPPLDRKPDRTVLLDLDPDIGLARARKRNDDLGVGGSEGRFENEALAFHERVRNGYLCLAEAEPFRFRIVAAEGAADRVEARIADLLSDLFPGLDEEEPS